MIALGRVSTRRLVFVIAGVCASAVGGAALAVAAGEGPPTPRAVPLDRAVHALSGHQQG
jgi:hypothetical protein